MALPLLLLLTQLQSQAPDPAANMRVTLILGEQKPSPVTRATGVNCDDRTVVEVVEVADHIELKGLRVGKTLCGFGQGKMPNQVVEVVVVVPPPPKKK